MAEQGGSGAIVAVSEARNALPAPNLAGLSLVETQTHKIGLIYPPPDIRCEEGLHARVHRGRETSLMGVEYRVPGVMQTGLLGIWQRPAISCMKCSLLNFCLSCMQGYRRQDCSGKWLALFCSGCRCGSE